MAVDYSISKFPKGPPRAITRHLQRAEMDAALAAAYREVDRRDRGLCRVTGDPTAPHAIDPRQRREHHHLLGRNVRPDLVNEPSNIVTVRADVHRLLQTHAIDVEGTDANQRLIFRWNRRVVPAGKEPFRIKSKRRSHNAER